MNEMKWIDINEELPKDNQFIVIYGIEEIFTNERPQYITCVIGARYSKIYGIQLYISKFKIIEIKYWIPLPEFSEGKKEVNKE